jgi:hypothetical protein
VPRKTRIVTDLHAVIADAAIIGRMPSSLPAHPQPRTARPPAPQQAGRKRASGLWPAVIAVLSFVGLGLATLCGGTLYVVGPRAWEAWQRSGWQDYYLGGEPNPGPVVVRSGMDWMTARLLSQVYTEALDVVVADRAVIERLGEPIEIDLAAEDLYRRKSTGDDEADQAIEFNIQGSQGKAVVRVNATGGFQQQQLHIKRILVTPESGEPIEVTPPPAQAFEVR